MGENYDKEGNNDKEGRQEFQDKMSILRREGGKEENYAEDK